MNQSTTYPDDLKPGHEVAVTSGTKRITIGVRVDAFAGGMSALLEPATARALAADLLARADSINPRDEAGEPGAVLIDAATAEVRDYYGLDGETAKRLMDESLAVWGLTGRAALTPAEQYAVLVHAGNIG